jgi:WD40 repeat protein
VRALGLLQDRKHLISGSYDSSVKIWEIQTGICQNTLTGHTKPVLAVQVIPHSEFACVSGGEDAVIKGWNWKQAICLWMIEMGKNEVWSLQSVRDLSTSTYGILSGHK